MKALIELIAKELVDSPDEVEVQEVIENGIVKIRLRVAEQDMGKVIGKQGKIAKAIRTVAKAAATKKNQKVVIEISQ
ncbi:MAG: KH domain-containing protein [Bacillota bacterium]|nr:KH domain-containing protein [Bacillota bacterium]